MRLTGDLTDTAILQALGERTERHRIEAGLTQSDLAREAGVSKRTVERIESGKGCDFTLLVRVLRVLKLLEGLNTLMPELPPSPMALLKLKGRERHRVVRRRKAFNPSASPSSSPSSPSSSSETPAPATAPRKPWTWGQ
ncbi:MAG TPA: helix-turn-helix transcriptional regulator [Steroidobacteraceae bacterium]|jgi:DNA-binding XRE family transcriptional regulator